MYRTLAGLVFLGLLVVACAPQAESPPAPTPEPGPVVTTEEVEYSAEGDVPLKGFMAWDSSISEPRPGVLVVHEWWGHNDYARERARQLAELGYTALALDMYGEGKQAAHPEDAQKFAGEVMQNLATGEARFNAALELLKAHPTTDPEKIAAIGYCFGGGVVLHMARIGADLDAVVSFHGSLATMKKAEPGVVKAKILVANGADDPFVPAEDIEAFKAEMEAAGVDYEFRSYEGAKHSFTNKAAGELGQKFGLPLAYNQAADEASWQAMQDLFAEVFAAQPATASDDEEQPEAR